MKRWLNGIGAREAKAMGVKKLTEKEVRQQLEETEGWELSDNRICKSFVFENFKQSMVFVKKVATIAEEQNHHPDIAIRYDQVSLCVWSHEQEGITMKDIRLIVSIDEVKK
jgi:4a-hydroxytetrahydrobiopterin dehydratase